MKIDAAASFDSINRCHHCVPMVVYRITMPEVRDESQAKEGRCCVMIADCRMLEDIAA